MPADQTPTPAEKKAERTFFRRALLWFFLGLPFSLLSAMSALSPMQMVEVAFVTPLTSGAPSGFASGAQILGTLTLILCFVYGWAVIVQHYFGRWSKARKYIFHAWMGALVASWLLLLTR